MKGWVLFIFFATLVSHAQEFTPGIGVYPGSQGIHGSVACKGRSNLSQSCPSSTGLSVQRLRLQPDSATRHRRAGRYRVQRHQHKASIANEIAFMPQTFEPRSRLPRSQSPSCAPASYVLWQNASSVSLGVAFARTSSYIKMNSLRPASY
jgi:hypothetical protein